MSTKTDKKKWKISRIRGVFLLIIFLSAVVGIVARTGWGNLSSMGYKAIAYICPLGAIESMFASMTIIPRALIVLIVVALLTLLFGKVFCSWICPAMQVRSFFRPRKNKELESDSKTVREPMAQATQDKSHVIKDALQNTQNGADEKSRGANEVDVANSVPAADRAELLPIGGKRDGFRIDSRHWVLAGAILSALVFGFPVFCLICPVGLTFATVISLWQLFVIHEPTWSLLIFPIVLIIELVFFKKWCHKLCPLGAFMSLLSQKSIFFQPKVDRTVCARSTGESCTTCVKECPEELDPHMDKIPECTKCALCIDKCPTNAISFKIGIGKSRQRQSSLVSKEQ